MQKTVFKQDIPGDIPGNDLEDDSDFSNTYGLGIAVTLLFLLVVLYSLITSASKTNKIGSAVLSKGKRYFTISQAVYYSSKPITFLTLIGFTALGLYMLYRKKLF